jgi:peptide chain release factor 1
MVPFEKLEEIKSRFQFIEAKLSEPIEPDELASLSKEYADLRPLVAEIDDFQRISSEIESAQLMLDDPDMRELAEAELVDLKAAMEGVEERLMIALIPKDAADEKSAIVEIRAGTGGDEAALFGSDLFRMYGKYAEKQGWRVDIIEESRTELGGIKELVANISGNNVFGRMKFESGVHRVQRVPETESGGRVHTSAATVAILPESQDVEIDIPTTDIRIDTMRASGSGGQHVNTTDSAVRITHLPTGIIVTSSEKSQHVNREKAMQVLKARLHDLEQQKLDQERSDARKGQIGSGDRSERIRTYNFPQGRMTDHRINLTLYKLDQIVEGDLDELIDALTAAEHAEKLAEMNL